MDVEFERQFHLVMNHLAPRFLFKEVELAEV